jgi:hypothetical protein
MSITEVEGKSVPGSLARIISAVFHPVFMPVYGLVIILSNATPFGYLPFPVKRLLFFIMLINNVFIPVSLLPFFKHMNYISSWSIRERKERTAPLIIASILYATTSYIVFRFPIPYFLKSFIFATFFLSLTVTGINLLMKVSLHAVGTGALVALIMMLSFRMTSALSWQLLSVVLAGAVLTSRLWLHEHNPEEVWTGFFTGFGCLVIFMLILQ